MRAGMQGRDQPHFEPWRRCQIVGGKGFFEPRRCGQCRCAILDLGGSRNDEMAVMVEISIVDGIGANAARIGLISRNGATVGSNGIVEAPNTVPSMARHMDHMRCRRCNVFQSRRRSGGTLGVGRCLGQVDEQVDRLRVIGGAREHGFNKGQRLADAALGNLPASLPIIPGLGRHDGFGSHDGNKIVIRKTGRKLDEHVGIKIGMGAILGAAGGIAGMKRLGQCPVTRAETRVGEHPRDKCAPLGDVLCGDRTAVDIGTDRQRLTPAAHGAHRVYFGSAAETLLRFVEVEAEQQAKALVEECLRLRIAADRHVRRCQALDQDGLAGG